MCLIAFAWQAHPRWRLLHAANRDERHARPSAPLACWGDLPLTGGRDLEAGGSWLGVTDSGRCGVVTNVRDPNDPQRGVSRDMSVTYYLAGDLDATQHACQRPQVAADYRPFNQLIFDAKAAFYLGNRPAAGSHAISPGVHGLSNADFTTPWPKTRALICRLQQWIDDGGERDFDAIFAALADEEIASGDLLPNTGMGMQRERWLSSAFIRGADYGTRASTVVAIEHKGRGVILERRFGPSGRFDGSSSLPIGAAATS